MSDIVGYKKITGHLVFTIKLGDNFHRKVRYCDNGHDNGKYVLDLHHYCSSVLCEYYDVDRFIKQYFNILGIHT